MMMGWERLNLHQGEALSLEIGSDGWSGPGKRWGHTCNSVHNGRFLYVFGGYGKDNRQTNQVHVFDTVGQTWKEPPISGTPPAPRDSHSCTTVGDNLYVFGGTDGSNPLSDLHILDTVSHTWRSPFVRGDAPQAREGHSAAPSGKRIFFFGGCGKSPVNNEEAYYNDLFVFNTETFVWKEMVTTGNRPSPRDSHTCTAWRNKIIVIGGEDGNNYYLSDVHILDTETLVWKELVTTGHKLPPRAGHSSVAIGNKIFVFGGFTDAQNLYDDIYMLDIVSATWTKVMVTGRQPSPRFSASGACLHPAVSGVLVFFGGCDKNLEPLDDMFFFHTGLTNVEDDHGVGSISMRKQMKMKCQEQLTNNFGSQSIFEEKRFFQAKVTERFLAGYGIETLIDGKALRGILFSNRKRDVDGERKLRPAASPAAKGVPCLDLNDDMGSGERMEMESVQGTAPTA